MLTNWLPGISLAISGTLRGSMTCSRAIWMTSVGTRICFRRLNTLRSPHTLMRRLATSLLALLRCSSAYQWRICGDDSGRNRCANIAGNAMFASPQPARTSCSIDCHCCETGSVRPRQPVTSGAYSVRCETRSGWRIAYSAATAAPCDMPNSGKDCSSSRSTTASRSATQSSNVIVSTSVCDKPQPRGS